MITELTPEQLEQLAVYRERGIAVGLATGPIDQDAARDYGKRLMAFLERDYRGTIIVPGPLAAWHTCLFLTALDDLSEEDRKDEKVMRELWDCMKDAPALEPGRWPWLQGQFDSYWVAWAQYYRDVVKLELPEFWQIEDQVQFGMVWALERWVVIMERPSRIEMTNGVLHKDGAPAVEYPDGAVVYALNGVGVPDWLALTPAEELDPARFATIENAEQRREFVRKVGIERIAEKCAVGVLDTQGDYELILIDLGGATGAWPYLKMKNPTIGVWHLECVPRNICTVQEALNWRAGDVLKSGEQWKPEQLT